MRPFEDVVAEHGSVVMRVCRAVAGPDDAEDAWSETFVSALRAYPDLPAESNVRGWLVTIAYRKALDQTRARARAASPSATIPDAPTWDRDPTGDGALRAALDRLPPKQKSAVIFRYLAELPYREIAGLLGASEAAARRNVSDGLANLRKANTEEDL